ncbi:MAG TPA: glycine betaine ABC transporter substrate-binding protein, partial [Actinomycetota bacterium]
TYGLRFDSFLPLDGGGSLTAEAIERGTVDVGVMFTTDGVLDEGNLVVLEDDRLLQPAENLTPIVREDAVERFGPGLVLALDRVSALLTTEALRTLNSQVALGADPAEVAHRWLQAHGSTTQEMVAQAGE